MISRYGRTERIISNWWKTKQNTIKGTTNDGRYIETSPIVDIQNRTVTTASGSKYHLSNPSGDFLLYLNEVEGKVFKWDHLLTL